MYLKDAETHEPLAASYGHTPVALYATAALTLFIGMFPEPVLRIGFRVAGSRPMNSLGAVVQSPGSRRWYCPSSSYCSGRLVIGYISLLERKVLADFQVRYGPMRVGPRGLLQPLADGLKFHPEGRYRSLQCREASVSACPHLLGFCGTARFHHAAIWRTSVCCWT